MDRCFINSTWDDGVIMTNKYNKALLLASAETLRQECHNRAANAGWWIDTETGEDIRAWPLKFQKLWISAKLMLIVTEIAEAMEGHRKSLADDHIPERLMIEVELADAAIRIFDLAGGLGLDIAGALVDKLEYNAKRADHTLAARVASGGKSI